MEGKKGKIMMSAVMLMCVFVAAWWLLTYHATSNKLTSYNRIDVDDGVTSAGYEKDTLKKYTLTAKGTVEQGSIIIELVTGDRVIESQAVVEGDYTIKFYMNKPSEDFEVRSKAVGSSRASVSIEATYKQTGFGIIRDLI